MSNLTVDNAMMHYIQQTACIIIIKPKIKTNHVPISHREGPVVKNECKETDEQEICSSKYQKEPKRPKLR